MNNWFQYLSLLFVLLSYISSLSAFRLDMAKPFRHFSYFLLFVLLSEIFGMAWPRKLYLYASATRNNQWFYNAFHFVSYLFYMYFYLLVIPHAKIRAAIKTIRGIYILFAIGNMLFVQGFMHLNTHTELLASFIMISLSIAYYYQLLYAKEIVSLKRDSVFWISTGILIYHLGSMMGLFLINVMNVVSNGMAQSIHLIIQASAILMYLNFSIAFLCPKKK